MKITSMMESMMMLEVCRIISGNREDGISSFVEPNDDLETQASFLEHFPDWGNDQELMELVEGIFKRRTKRQ